MTVLAIGSSLIDLFLKPNPRRLNQSTDSIQLKLGDKISTEFLGSSIGGNAANISYALNKLNVNSHLYTYLANDFFSKEIESLLTNEGITLHKENVSAKTSFSIILSLEGDRIIFSHHDKYNHDFKYQNELPSIIYLTSIGKEWSAAYEKVLEYCNQNNVDLAFSPGSHQLKELNELVINTLKKSKYFFSNKEEAQKIIEYKSINAKTPHEILNALSNLGPEIISITDGNNGSFGKDSKSSLKIGVPNTEIVEKTGAGDAYAATFLACYTQTTNLEKSMIRATLNANSVIKKVGAHNGLLSKESLDIAEEQSNLTVNTL